VATSCARGAWLLVLLWASAIDVIDGSSPDVPVVCVDTGLSGGDLDDLVRRALEVLRQSGHDPDGYRLDLKMEWPATAGFARHGQAYLSVVFSPEDGDDCYPLRVDRNDPCAVSWVWRPDRFTPWQRRVIERAREVLRDSWPGGSGEDLTGVTVVETAGEVTVRLTLGELDDSDLAPSRAEVRLRKSDLGAVE